jgi:hypothetical protein
VFHIDRYVTNSLALEGLLFVDYNGGVIRVRVLGECCGRSDGCKLNPPYSVLLDFNPFLERGARLINPSPFGSSRMKSTYDPVVSPDEESLAKRHEVRSRIVS